MGRNSRPGAGRSCGDGPGVIGTRRGLSGLSSKIRFGAGPRGGCAAGLVARSYQRIARRRRRGKVTMAIDTSAKPVTSNSSSQFSTFYVADLFFGVDVLHV